MAAALLVAPADPDKFGLGAAGHVNVASGHHTLPLADHWVRAQVQARAQSKALVA